MKVIKSGEKCAMAAAEDESTWNRADTQSAQQTTYWILEIIAPRLSVFTLNQIVCVAETIRTFHARAHVAVNLRLSAPTGAVSV